VIGMSSRVDADREGRLVLLEKKASRRHLIDSSDEMFVCKVGRILFCKELCRFPRKGKNEKKAGLDGTVVVH